MKRKLFSTIAILCMLCAFLPTFVSAANQTLESTVTVKSDGVYLGTSDTAATPEELALYGISFTKKPLKLTLNNATIITETGIDKDEELYTGIIHIVNSAIYFKVGGELELIGDNVVSNKTTASNRFVSAVHSIENLTVTGADGKLVADIKDSSSLYGASVSCEATFTNSSNIELQRGSVQRSSEFSSLKDASYGLYANNIRNSGTLITDGGYGSACGIGSIISLNNSGTIIAYGKTYGVYVPSITNTGNMTGSSTGKYGVYATTTFENKGKDSVCNAKGTVNGMYAKNLNNEGTIKAGGIDTDTKAGTDGIDIGSKGSITNSGKIEARGCESGLYIPGSFTNNAGGEIVLEAGAAGKPSYTLYGTGKITNSGTLETYVTNGGSSAYAIYVTGDIENKAGATINSHIDTSSGEENKWFISGNVYGIYANGYSITNNGTITVTTPKNGKNNYGIFVTKNLTNTGEIDVTAGGSTGATGASIAINAASGDVTNSGTITAVSDDAYISRGIVAGSRLLNSGGIGATAGNASGESIGIMVSNSSSAQISLQNDEAGQITASAKTYGVFVASGILYNDGEFTATAPTYAYTNNSGGLYLPNAGDKITAHGNVKFAGGFGDYYTVTGSTTSIVSNSLTCTKDPVVIENKKYTVSFNTNGAGTVNPQVTCALVTEPTGLSKKGYTLDGWYTDSEFKNKFNFSSTAVRSDMTLYAKWIADSIALTVDKDKNYTVDVTTASIEGTVLVALYDGDKLVKVNEHPLSDSAQITGSFTDEGTKVKAFWWDSTDGMQSNAPLDVKDIPAQ